MAAKIKNLKPSTFETIDAAVLSWLDDIMNIHATTNEGWKKVPVFWLTAERAAQREVRRETFSEALIFPMISVERTKVAKTDVGKRPIPGNIFPKNDYRKGSFEIHRRVNHIKTKNFKNADTLKTYKQINFPWKDKFGKNIPNKKTVYQTITIPMPVYYDMTYTINMRADYQQQMNEMLQPIIVHTGGISQFIIEKNEYSYEAFLDGGYNFDNNVASLGEEEKKYETTLELRVLGYVVGAEKNQDTPKMVIRENQVEFKFQRERVILGDINEYSINDDEEKESLVPRHKNDKNPFKP